MGPGTINSPPRREMSGGVCRRPWKKTDDFWGEVMLCLKQDMPIGFFGYLPTKTSLMFMSEIRNMFSKLGFCGHPFFLDALL